MAVLRRAPMTSSASPSPSCCPDSCRARPSASAARPTPSQLRAVSSRFPAEAALSLIEEAPGDALLLASVHDLTERFELGAQRERADRLESHGIAAGGANAHDFNNLLGVILNDTTLRERQVDDPRVAADGARSGRQRRVRPSSRASSSASRAATRRTRSRLRSTTPSAGSPRCAREPSGRALRAT